MLEFVVFYIYIYNQRKIHARRVQELWVRCYSEGIALGKFPFAKIIDNIALLLVKALGIILFLDTRTVACGIPRASAINYINSSLYKCILKTAVYTDIRVYLHATIISRAKVLRAFTSAKGIRRPCYVFLSIVPSRSCEVIPTMIGGRLTVAFGYFTSSPRTRPCAWAWKMRLIRRAAVTRGTCVAAQELLRGQLA